MREAGGSKLGRVSADFRTMVQRCTTLIYLYILLCPYINYINMIITPKIERMSVFLCAGYKIKEGTQLAIAHIVPYTIYWPLEVNQIIVTFRTGFGPYMPKV